LLLAAERKIIDHVPKRITHTEEDERYPFSQKQLENRRTVRRPHWATVWQPAQALFQATPLSPRIGATTRGTEELFQT
jgi:hypothetical protein